MEAGLLPADPRLENVYRRAAAADGHMGVAELKTALAELGVFLSDAELRHVVEKHDVDSSGSLSLDEFACIFGEGKLRSIFLTIDVDRSGAIDAAELRLALNNLGYALPASEIARILKKVDADASGQVSPFFSHLPPPQL
jgi:Ca2+-binding EF-hand superfamily protein